MKRRKTKSVSEPQYEPVTAMERRIKLMTPKKLKGADLSVNDLFARMLLFVDNDNDDDNHKLTKSVLNLV